jgi:ABC-type nickel/cobalt efflux system permease component RcnA
MQNLGVILIFWYGILHAFGPDHLTAIADFSIGKNKKKTMLITILFAIGHGSMLFVFAKILQTYNISENLLKYGDIISSSVILAMGFYLLYMVYMDKIHLKKHTHKGKEHIHIYFGNKHNHNSSDTSSAFTIGALMGIGGVRGMLITLGAIQGQSVDFTLIFAFTAGVMLIFIIFGAIILYINQNLLNNKQNIKRIFATAGAVSVIVGTNMLFADEPIHSHNHNANHTHNFNNANELVKSKQKSNMSYKQMMMQMGEAYKLMQTGLLTQNKELIALGANMIQNHPAPKTKPWLIMPKDMQDDFKQTLIAYDKLLHEGISNIINSLETDDFATINANIYELSNHCISCHSAWQNKVVGVNNF